MRPRKIGTVVSSAILSWLLLGQNALPDSGPPVFGNQTATNRYQASYALIYSQDFEGPQTDTFILQPTVQLTSDAALVIDGKFSLRMSGDFAEFGIKPEVLKLEPFKIYIIEYDYRILSKSPDPLPPLGAGIWANGQLIDGQPLLDLGGPGSQLPAAGHVSRGVRVGNAPVMTFVLYARKADAVVDNIRIYRQDVLAYLGKTRLIDVGFPRLLGYQLNTPEGIGGYNNVDPGDVERIMTGYDLITGSDSDHTLGPLGWVRRVRALNPKIRIVPYQQSFMAQFEGVVPVWDTAGLQGMFNRGLPNQWFMVDTLGNRLAEPDFPGNVQLDHTPYCPLVGGMTAGGYIRDFVTRTLLPSGLWDGIHFDQPEWYVNTLLVRPDGTLPPIDLERTGNPTPQARIFQAWKEGFLTYFDSLADKVGYSQLLFGNDGYISANSVVLSRLNGWLMEIFTPFRILPSGDWQTNEGGYWYRFINNYLQGAAYVRAPQVFGVELTGRGLGELTGSLTANGYPQRTAKVESRDFRRMRLGLTTTLLGNGFFQYSLVDNTSPPTWFDEFAIGAGGVATRDYTGKGYLGQPLADAAEVAFPATMVFLLDFESGGTQTPAGVSLGPYLRLTSDPKEVIDGKFSLVFSRQAPTDNGLLFITNPSVLPLQIGKTYQLLMAYKILEHNPTTFKDLLGIGISRTGIGLTTYQIASLYYQEVSGPGQTGFFRTSVKATEDGLVAMGFLTDTGTVVVDDITLVEGPGGVWRRDFENGIVLVNPTSETITVSQSDVSGPLLRTGIRRILGTQDPNWNNGQAVTAGITIPSGDGIILLADRIAAPRPLPPTGLSVQASASGATLQWDFNLEYVAGYLMRYGKDSTRLTREAAVGPVPGLTLRNLDPATPYFFQVAAYDFLGNLSDYSPVVRAVTTGIPLTNKPGVSGISALVVGQRASLQGVALADRTEVVGAPPYPTSLGSASVLVNGAPAALVSVSPSNIEFFVPSEVAGAEAVVHVVRNNVWSDDKIVPLQLPSSP